jgi:hypothetical protein
LLELYLIWFENFNCPTYDILQVFQQKLSNQFSLHEISSTCRMPKLEPFSGSCSSM